ncbi:MAG: prepilin-type N-terminal cleavage/methylation domain-containing protein [bacterium]
MVHIPGIPDDRLGFTLIELIISLALSSIVIAAAINFFSNMDKSFQAQAQVGTAQQNGRVALEYLARSIQNAGYNVVRGRRFLCASDRYLTTVFDEDGDGTIQNTEVITYCISKKGASATENLQIFAYFDRDGDGEVEADEGADCTIGLALSGPVYSLYQAIPNLTDENSAKEEIASDIENLIIRYYDQDNKPLPVTRQDPDDPNSPRIAPTPPYDFSSAPQELNAIRRIEMELMVRSDRPLPGYAAGGTYPDGTAATYDESGEPRTGVSYQEGYYHHTFRINVSPRNLIEAPWGRVFLEADPNSVPCFGSSSVIRATLVDGNGDSLANHQITFCVNYDDEDGSADAYVNPNVVETNSSGVASTTLTYDWSSGPKTFTVSAVSVIDIDPGPMSDYKTLYNAIGVAFHGLTINWDPNSPPPYEAGDTTVFQATGGVEPYTFQVSPAPPNPQSWTLSTPAGFIDHDTGLYQATSVGTILVQATDYSGCTEVKLICPQIVLSHSPAIDFSIGQSTTFSASQGTPPYRWMTNTPSVGVIDPNSGVYTQVGAGITIVMAIDYNNCVGQVYTCPQINITPQGPNLALGGSVTFSASGGEAPYTWSSSDTSVGTIDSDTGSFSMAGYGHTVITATDTNGCYGQIPIDTCQVLNTVPGSSQYQEGETITFVTFDGTAPYTWASSQPLVGEIDVYGHFSAVSRGQTTITVTDDNGCQGQATATVCGQLTITPSTSDYDTGQTVTLSASGGESPYYWISSDPNIASIAMDGTMHTESQGEVTITVADAYGCQGSISLTITEASHEPLFRDDFLSTDNWDVVSGNWHINSGYLRGIGQGGNAIIAVKSSVWNASWVDYVVILKVWENTHGSGYDDVDGGLLTRYQASNQNYKVEMDADSAGLHLDRWNGGEYVLSSAPFSYTTNEWYYQKVKVEGNVISVKAWKATDPEPASWAISCTDNTFTYGRVGLRVYSADAKFDSIEVWAINDAP